MRPIRCWPSRTLSAILLIQVLLCGLIKCQISDGDDQFEAVHQDIGRISGLNGGAQVAPKSTLVARPQQHNEAGSQLASPPVTAAAIAQVFDRPASGPATPRTSRPLSGSSRKPNRITLVARRDPLPSPTSALVAAQLPAPSQLDAPAALSAPTYTPTFAAAPSPAAPVPLVEAQPAFRSFATAPHAAVHSPTHSASVSARHSALMAQVAAERAAAQGLVDSAPILPPPPPPPTQQEVAPSSFANQAAAGQHLPQPHFVAQPQAQHQPQAAPTSAQGQAVFLSQPEEPQVAPSFEHVLGHGCPHKGVYSWENRDHCDRYYMCTNGTFTEEACPNGLAYSQQGAVYQHCAYNWNVDCGHKKAAQAISSPGCPWQFGLFPIVQNGRCSIDYFACEWGVPETKRCSPEGLFYDDRIKGCQWADQLGCKSEKLLNFKCPPEDEDNPYWPYPRYYHDNKDVIVCVNEQPRLVHCNEDQLVDPSSLACVDIEGKKKKKPF